MAMLSIGNPFRSLKRETAQRLAELTSDLECGLIVEKSIVKHWTAVAEGFELGETAALDAGVPVIGQGHS